MALFLEPRAERNFNLNSNQLAVNFVTTKSNKTDKQKQSDENPCLSKCVANR
jgi:hypothetical protein